jgi:hypothetical protein
MGNPACGRGQIAHDNHWTHQAADQPTKQSSDQRILDKILGQQSFKKSHFEDSKA